jgi:hypothetical protein
MNMEQGIPAAIMKNPNMTNLELEQSLDDDDDDNMEFAKTVLSSVNMVDGIQDIGGFIIVCFVSLVGDMSWGVFFPTVWPLVQSLGRITVTLGYSVASLSFGRILLSPIFGSWSVTYAYKRTILLSTTFLLCGTLLYGQVVNVGRTDYFIFT